MKHLTKVDKHEFIRHANHYLKEAEGNIVIITHQGKPTLKLTRLKDKTIDDLRGLIKHVRVVGNIHDPVFPGCGEDF